VADRISNNAMAMATAQEECEKRKICFFRGVELVFFTGDIMVSPYG
jgi:hypothetical protein